MTGETIFLGKKQYLKINEQGTLEVLPSLKWYQQIYLFLKQRFNPMGLEDVRKYVARSAKEKA